MDFYFHRSTATPTIIVLPCHPFTPSYGQTSSPYHQSNGCTTLPSAKFSFLGLSFIRTYSFSLSVSLKPSFHALLPLSCILSQIYFFHPSRSTFIPRFTIPLTLTSLRQIRFTNSNNPNLLHIYLHLDHHLELHPILIRNALPISDTIFSSNTTLNIHHCLCFSLFKSTPLCFPSNQFISNISHIPKSSTHSILPYFQIITFMLVLC